MKIILSKYYLLLFFLTSVLVSCTTKTTTIYTDNIKDKNQAESIATKFYEALKKQEYANTFNLFSPKFFQFISEEALLKNYNKISNEQGIVTNTNLAHWHTITVSNDESKNVYTLTFDVERKINKTIETLTFYMENGNIKIVNYDIKFSINRL
ncbi:hypothetical protein [Pedobacter rhodius]|uniref:DUF3887 domain-containing protein n=1 Tax=Pedobacter rhodius TaxID=3004098 RepID=A0ABT4L0F0_9SPHI|nr:hypothetical protein [Pedobacter sp. SJ11]MCZ4224658.1 hypothetical protein [Pedobacter sp. SJ11]